MVLHQRLIKGLPQKQTTSCSEVTVDSKSSTTNNNETHDGTVPCTQQESNATQPQQYQALKRQRGEVVFFKLLHAEVHKATHFFQETQERYASRLRLLSSEMAAIEEDDERQLLQQKIFWLHQSLLRLEVFAIMSYCAFSKILKKHDKATGFDTKAAFMEKIVNLTCITHTPRIQAMIEQCQRWMAHPKLKALSPELEDQEEKKPSQDDQRLFLETIQQLHNNEKESSCGGNNRDSLVSMLSTVRPNASNPSSNWLRAVSSASEPQQKRIILRQVSESAGSVASDNEEEEGEQEASERSVSSSSSNNNKRQTEEDTTAESHGLGPVPKKTKLAQ